MIVLVETADAARAAQSGDVMVKTRSFSIEKTVFCRARALLATVALPSGMSPHRAEKRIRRALEKLRFLGVRTVLTERRFPFAKLLGEYGMSAPDSGAYAFRNALAPLLVDYAVDNLFSPLADITAALFAARPSREANIIARRLLERCRTLAVRFERGGDSFADEVYARMGVTVLQTEAAFNAADFRVVLGGHDAPPPVLGAVTLDCTACGAELLLPDWFEPRGYDPLEVACELHRAGALVAGEIKVLKLNNANSLDISWLDDYNIAQS